MNYIITFYTHFGATFLKAKCDLAGFENELSPTPRALSASCGVCLRLSASDYEPLAEFVSALSVDADIDALFIQDSEGYQQLLHFE